MSPLEHLKANSLRLNAERRAHNEQIAELSNKIADAAAALAHAERTFGIESDQAVAARAVPRKLKQDRTNLKSPVLIDPFPEAETFLAANPKAQAAEPVAADIRAGETPLMAYNRAQETTNLILRTIRGIETAPRRSRRTRCPIVRPNRRTRRPWRTARGQWPPDLRSEARRDDQR